MSIVSTQIQLIRNSRKETEIRTLVPEFVLHPSSYFGIARLCGSLVASGMARKPRVEFAGAVYHVMCRGDRRKAIFRDDADRERFLETLVEGRERTGWLIHGYILMGYYHLLLETSEANLVAAHDEAGAEALLRAGLKELNLTYQALAALPKSDPCKQVLAWWMRKQTAVSNQWLADKLVVGHAGNLSKMVKTVDSLLTREMKQMKKRVAQG